MELDDKTQKSLEELKQISEDMLLISKGFKEDYSGFFTKSIDKYSDLEYNNKQLAIDSSELDAHISLFDNISAEDAVKFSQIIELFQQDKTHQIVITNE